MGLIHPSARKQGVTAPIPENEVARVQTLHQYAVLNTAPEPAYDQLAELAASICGTPLAAVSLIDSDRQWIKANVGLATRSEF
jgi:hypothetical protein